MVLVAEHFDWIQYAYRKVECNLCSLVVNVGIIALLGIGANVEGESCRCGQRDQRAS